MSYKKIRNMCRSLIKECQEEKITLSELEKILKMENEEVQKELAKVPKNVVEDKITRSPEEIAFKIKAENFISDVKISGKYDTVFDNPWSKERFVEILCVYFSYWKETENNITMRITMSDRLWLIAQSSHEYQRYLNHLPYLELCLKKISFSYLTCDNLHELDVECIIAQLVQYIDENYTDEY